MRISPYRSTTEPFTDAVRIASGEAYMRSLLHPQHDAHVRGYRSFVAAYGSREGYHLEMARKANSDAKLMRTADGRAFILKRNNDHSAWRASRAGLPF